MNSKVKRTVVSWLLLLPLVVLVLFPYAVMFITAIKPTDEVRNATWWPSHIVWYHFTDMWTAANFGTALLNSIYVSVLGTLVSLFVSIPAAYALSRFRFTGHGPYRIFLLITQMLSPVVLVIGLFRLVIWLGLVNSVNSLVFIYGAFFTAFTVLMLQNYFDTIPKDLEEAAWIEGAGPWQALIKVFLPLATPAIAVTAIFAFINSWNEFVIALTMLRSQDTYTLPIQIFSMIGGYTVRWGNVMAATLVATIPVAIVFSWLQRYLVRGLSLGAVK